MKRTCYVTVCITKDLNSHLVITHDSFWFEFWEVIIINVAYFEWKDISVIYGIIKFLLYNKMSEEFSEHLCSILDRVLKNVRRTERKFHTVTSQINIVNVIVHLDSNKINSHYKAATKTNDIIGYLSSHLQLVDVRFLHHVFTHFLLNALYEPLCKKNVFSL